MLHFEIIIPNIQSERGNKSGVRSIWKPTGAHSRVVDITADSEIRDILLPQYAGFMPGFSRLCVQTPPTGETTEGIRQSVYIYFTNYSV